MIHQALVTQQRTTAWQLLVARRKCESGLWASVIEALTVYLLLCCVIVICALLCSLTYAGHSGHVQLVSLVTVAGVTLCNTNAPAVLTAVQDPTILSCAQAGV